MSKTFNVMVPEPNFFKFLGNGIDVHGIVMEFTTLPAVLGMEFEF